MMKCTLHQACLVVIFLCPLVGFGQPPILASFSPILPQLTGASMAWGDYDSDGDPDLFLSGVNGQGNSFTHLLKNNATSFDIDSSQIFPPLLGASAAWGDYDNDGDPDLAICGSMGQLSPKTQLYRNDGGNMTSIPTAAPDLMNGQVQWADLDGDSDLDFFLTGYSLDKGNQWTVLENLGNGQFASYYRDLGHSETVVSSATGDINGDGLIDLSVGLFQDYLESEVAVLINQGNFQFQSLPHHLETRYHPDLALADMDGDQQAELLVCGDASLAYTEVVDFNGNLMFPQFLGLNGVTLGSVAWLDFDQDGDLDMIATGLAGQTGTTLVYQNQSGAFSLFQSPNTLPQLIHTHLAVADWNGDGYDDFVLSGQDINAIPFTYLLTFDPLTQQFQP